MFYFLQPIKNRKVDIFSEQRLLWHVQHKTLTHSHNHTHREREKDSRIVVVQFFCGVEMDMLCSSLIPYLFFSSSVISAFQGSRTENVSLYAFCLIRVLRSRPLAVDCLLLHCVCFSTFSNFSPFQGNGSSHIIFILSHMLGNSKCFSAMFLNKCRHCAFLQRLDVDAFYSVRYIGVLCQASVVMRLQMLQDGYNKQDQQGSAWVFVYGSYKHRSFIQVTIVRVPCETKSTR